MAIVIRQITSEDNLQLARIIRSALAEFGANKPGTVYFDPTTDALSDLFTTPGSVYLVAEENDELLGGAGIFPTEGLPADTCELVKMYLAPAARGKGLGRQLIEEALRLAKQYGYSKVYLETMPELQQAVRVYEKSGFQFLEGPMGNTGHFGCSKWMLKQLD